MPNASELPSRDLPFGNEAIGTKASLLVEG